MVGAILRHGPYGSSYRLMSGDTYLHVVVVEWRYLVEGAGLFVLLLRQPHRYLVEQGVVDEQDGTPVCLVGVLKRVQHERRQPARCNTL